MTWDDFEQHFYDRYFPVALKQTRIKEFFELEQGNMTVAEYVSKYIELGKYAKALVADENTKVVKFMLGLKDGIRRYIMGQGTKTYREIVDAAYALEQDHLIFLKKKASAGGSVGNKGKKKLLINLKFSKELKRKQFSNHNVISRHLRRLTKGTKVEELEIVHL
ncbi:hypothetical protein ACFX19_044652 [Malus domestica]